MDIEPARGGGSPPPDAFFTWQQFSQTVPVLPVGGIVSRGCTTTLAPEVVAAYDAPFPEERFKAGARQFPLLVPRSPTIRHRRPTVPHGKC